MPTETARIPGLSAAARKPGDDGDKVSAVTMTVPAVTAWRSTLPLKSVVPSVV